MREEEVTKMMREYLDGWMNKCVMRGEFVTNGG